jgi:transposase
MTSSIGETKSINRRNYPQWDNEIIELYLDGYSIREIAEIIHWSSGFVRRRLLKNNITLRTRGGNRMKFNTSKDVLVKYYYENGYSLVDAAKLTGLSKNGARTALRREGVKIRPRGGAGRNLITKRIKEA